MVAILHKFADRMLAGLVPNTVASASVCTPEWWCSTVVCTITGWTFFRYRVDRNCNLIDKQCNCPLT